MAERAAALPRMRTYALGDLEGDLVVRLGQLIVELATKSH
jgi:hypothetical protein